jgi:hypothetical protein
LQEEVRRHGAKDLVQRAREYLAAQRTAREGPRRREPDSRRGELWLSRQGLIERRPSEARGGDLPGVLWGGGLKRGSG